MVRKELRVKLEVLVIVSMEGKGMMKNLWGFGIFLFSCVVLCVKLEVEEIVE